MRTTGSGSASAAIRRGTFTTVTALEDAIRDYIDSYNTRAKPFTWTKTADYTLTNANRERTSNTRHQHCCNH